MNIGIIGMGHVGSLTKEILSPYCNIVEYDKKSNSQFDCTLFQKSDYIIICVNTPTDIESGANIENIRDVLKLITWEVPIVLRSTVPPGTTLQLSDEFGKPVAFWPEYIGETQFIINTWERLSYEEPYIIMGVKGEDTTYNNWIDFLAESYGPMCRFLLIEPTAAELVKYMENAYFAVKTTFVNEFREISEALDVRWQDVRQGWLLDPRIDRDHSDSFGHNRGFGGKCLPKDLDAIIRVCHELGVRSQLLEATAESNKNRS